MTATLTQVRGELLSVRSEERVQLVDITPRLLARVRRSGIRDGLLLVHSMHTTMALFINETQEALLGDIKAFLGRIAPREEDWRHNDPRFSDCDRKNADAHLRAMLLGHSLVLPVHDGELVLGTFQAVIAAELDGPRSRAIHIQVLGCD